MVFSIRKDETFNEKLQHNLTERFKRNRRSMNEAVHVSDITSGCIRKAWFRRKYPDDDTIDINTALHFLRGIAYQHALTLLLQLDSTEVPVESKDNELVGHIDAIIVEAGKECVVEMKSTNTIAHFDINHTTFKEYLRQALYYLVLSGLEKAYIIIKYEQQEQRFYKIDKHGYKHYIRERSHRPARLETWEIVLSKDSIERQKIEAEMMESKVLFLESLQSDNVAKLPRLTGPARYIKCRSCPYYDKCFNKSEQDQSAIEYASKVSILDQLTLNPSVD